MASDLEDLITLSPTIWMVLKSRAATISLVVVLARGITGLVGAPSGSKREFGSASSRSQPISFIVSRLALTARSSI